MIKELKERGEINLSQIPGSKELTKGKKHLEDKYQAMVKRNKSARQKALKSGLSIVTVNKLEKVNTPKNRSSRLEDLINQFNQERKKE